MKVIKKRTEKYKRTQRIKQRKSLETKRGKKDIKQNEQIQNRENVEEDFKLGIFYELATTKKIYVNRLN